VREQTPGIIPNVIDTGWDYVTIGIHERECAGIDSLHWFGEKDLDDYIFVDIPGVL
jgi:hypothetical protein